MKSQSCKHVLVSGTGRAGTTFLMDVLMRCGVETGFDEAAIDKRTTYSHSGMECWNWSSGPLNRNKWPHVVKCCIPIPKWGDDVLGPVWRSIDHIIVPIRDPSAAAESRHSVQRAVGGPGHFPCGGLLPSDVGKDLQSILEARHYWLCLCAARWEIPLTHLHYPRLIKDPAYLHEHLEKVFTVGTFSEFEERFVATRRRDWIHQYNDSDAWKAQP